MSKNTLRRLQIAGAAALFAFVGQVGAAESEVGSGRKRVIELFTSQGCSSCPPADALLESYKARSDVIALSFPVDYWDRLGWKDTFGSRENSDRQRAYARGRGDGEVYTPQVVVDGRAHTIGSVRSSIDGVLSNTRTEVEAERVALKSVLEDGHLNLSVGAARSPGKVRSGVVLLAAVMDSGTVNIGRGENSGRKITYHNVVRSLRSIGTWDGSGQRLRVALTEAERSCCSSAVVLIQQSAGGPILAADQIRIK